MSAELSEHAVQVMLRASAVTLSVLLQAAQAAVQRHKGYNRLYTADIL